MHILTFQGTKEVNGNSNIEDKVYTITVFTPLCQYRISQKRKQGSGFKGCQRLVSIFVNVRQNFGNQHFCQFTVMYEAFLSNFIVGILATGSYWI